MSLRDFWGGKEKILLSSSRFPTRSRVGLQSYLFMFCIAQYRFISKYIPLFGDVKQIDSIDMPVAHYEVNGLDNTPERAKTEAGKAIRRHIARTFFQ